MASIGDLGTPREAVDMTFGYFGLVIRVNPNASDLDLVEFMTEASAIDELDDAQGMLALGRYLKNLIHVEDWPAFWAASKGNRQMLSDLMGTAQSIVEAVTGFPTGQPAASSTGRQPTDRKSKGGSSSPASARRSQRAVRGQRTDTDRALTLLQGRPDLQHTVALAQEARTALAG